MQRSMSATIVKKFLLAENSRDWKAVQQLVHPYISYSIIGSAHKIKGRTNYLKWMQETYQQMPDWRFSIDNLVAEEDVVIVEFNGKGHFSGLYKGKAYEDVPLRLRAVCVFELRDGQIYQEREYWDFQGYERQLNQFN